jgi:signal transduction histidine kinase
LTRTNAALTDEVAERLSVERRLVEQAGILRSILSDMGDAVIVADAAERFVVFNPAAERLFGKGAVAGPSEAWPQIYGLYLADRETPLPADEMPLLRSIRGEEVNDVDLFVRHAAAPTGLWTRVSGRPLRDASGAISGGAIVCRDITEMKWSEEAISLLNMIIMEVAAAEDLTASLQVVLRRVCEKTGWAFGQAWIVSRDSSHLVCSDAWHATIPGLEEFRADSRATRFVPGAGLPGRVWASAQPAWIRDVTVDTNFPRVRAAEAVGLKAALGLPIVAQHRVVAVVEFFLQEPRQEDERLVKLIGTVAAELDLVLERKHAEEALHESYERIQDLAGRLIVAEEAERTRIARDLHDDINQRLAGLSIALSGLKRRVGELDETMLGQSLTALQERTIALVDNVRRLSHELHPGVLQHAGIAAALESHCAEFSEQHGIDVDLVTDDVGAIGPDASLCLFRVAQEVMRNVARHAAAHRVRVTLSRGGDATTMTIADDGRGFDANDVRRAGRGLGLLSIEERVRLLKGSVTIDSSAERGTTLQVTIP